MRDFVELPSQINEHWATEPEVLKMYAKHYQTGEVIPDEIIEKILQQKTFNQGFFFECKHVYILYICYGVQVHVEDGGSQ